MKGHLDAAGVVNQEPALRQASGEAFYNMSPFRLRDLTSRARQQQLRADFEARRDFTGRDALESSIDREVVVALSRWTVRADVVSWTEGDTFEDADGQTWTVEGVTQLDRGRFVELMAKRVG